MFRRGGISLDSIPLKGIERKKQGLSYPPKMKENLFQTTSSADNQFPADFNRSNAVLFFKFFCIF